jgi:hypothetical protein
VSIALVYLADTTELVHPRQRGKRDYLEFVFNKSKEFAHAAVVLVQEAAQ